MERERRKERATSEIYRARQKVGVNGRCELAV